MKNIVALIDYKNRFGSKHFDSPYRSGMDKSKLSKYFANHDYDLLFESIHNFSKIVNEYRNFPVIYTSSEDNGYTYKAFIEDIIFGLSSTGIYVIPAYEFLKANNNKVLMEIFRESKLSEITSGIKTNYYGTLEELTSEIENITFPCVLKASEGASGKGVHLCNNTSELLSTAKKISRTKDIKYELHDRIRKYKHKGYQRDSLYTRKFIIQNLIPELKNDWKVYIFGSRLYVFYRPILKGRGIKASGGGYDNYFYGLEASTPEGLFDFAENIYNKLKVPHISIDIAFDGKQFYLVEFQAIYFGTAGIPYSNGYFTKKENKWEFIEENLEIEQVYAEAIIDYIHKPF